MLRNSAALLLLWTLLVCPVAGLAQSPSPSPSPQSAQEPAATPTPDPNDPIERIKDEAMKRSQVMQTLSYLTRTVDDSLDCISEGLVAGRES